MNELEKYLKTQIEAHGPIDVGMFMNIALGHPQHGYYMKKDPFGAGGDFTTAPEISQMFGEVIGAWVADIWMQMGSPDKFTLLECGPGRGTLMADILRAAQNVSGFRAACNVHLLEISPVLKKIQEETLKACHARADGHPAKDKEGQTPAFAGVTTIGWHQTLETVPDDVPIIVIANEFFDALPVRQMVPGGERKIDLKDDVFVFTGDGPISEVSPASISFMNDLCALMKKASGVALIIDYGYLEGSGDTFQAVYKHQYVSPLEHIGDADLTAHVDFGALKQIAFKNGVQVSGPVEQGAFLKAIGIEQRAAYLSGKTQDQDQIKIALKRLTDSSQMGSLFKVMSLHYGASISPSGF